MVRDVRWSEAIAVGNLSFVEKLKSELRFKAAHPAALRRFNGDLAWSDPWPTHLTAKVETYEQEIVRLLDFRRERNDDTATKKRSAAKRREFFWFEVVY
jgi:hypothetical protein